MSKKPSAPRKWKSATLGIHGLDRTEHAHFAVSTPIAHTSNYYFNNTQEVYDFMKAKSEGIVIREHEYGRYGNPTQTECERKLAAVEGAERAVLFSTGMAAVILTIMTFMRRDGHIIFTSDCYRQTRDFAANLLAEFGIQVSMADPTAEAIEKAIRPNTNIIFTESPTKPYLRCLDLEAVVKVAKAHKVLTVIDATLATPYDVKAIEMGVDVVVPSAPKYLGGHNDIRAGGALGSYK